jgi:hypothetical protein
MVPMVQAVATMVPMVQAVATMVLLLSSMPVLRHQQRDGKYFSTKQTWILC